MDCHDMDENRALRAELAPGTNTSSIEAVSISLCTQRILNEYADQSQFIDMDLEVLCNWEKSSKARSFQKSLDSQDFEFNRFTMVPDLLETKHVAPADELFFKGQLLPLQHDPREQLVQTLSHLGGDLSLPLICPLEQDVTKVGAYTFEGGESGSLLDVGETESRSSSFRSRHSSYWESGEKNSRDSSSSSCSNGSSMQDTCLPREHDVDTEFSNDKSGRKMNNPEAEPARKWSWKALFNTLKQASKMRGDEGAQNRPVFSRNSVQSAFISSAAGRQGSSGCTDSPKKKLSLQAKQHWQRCVNKVKPLYRKFSFPKHNEDASGWPGSTKPNCDQRQLIAAAAATSRSSSSTPLMKSPARRADSGYLHHSSRRFTSVVASCPASMRSSPHHSGVLAVVNKGSSGNSAGYNVHDLHNAIQGAIAHCKQSQCGRSSAAL